MKARQSASTQAWEQQGFQFYLLMVLTCLGREYDCWKLQKVKEKR